jgi:hypothetical protein
VRAQYFKVTCILRAIEELLQKQDQNRTNGLCEGQETRGKTSEMEQMRDKVQSFRNCLAGKKLKQPYSTRIKKPRGFYEAFFRGFF